MRRRSDLAQRACTRREVVRMRAERDVDEAVGADEPLEHGVTDEGLHLDRTEELVPPSRRTTELRASVCLHQTRSWWQPRLELGPPARLALEGAEELDGREVVRDLAHESVVLAPVSPRLHGA